MRITPFALAAAIPAVVVTMASVATTGSSSAHPNGGDRPIVLTGEATPEVRHLVSVVVRAAQGRDVAVVPAEIDIRFIDRVDSDRAVGGWTDGVVVLVGANGALPKRTLLHELTHAVVGVEIGHDEPWRSVYIAAVGDVFGDRMAERELRRIRWVYDKSYLVADPAVGEAVAASPNRCDIGPVGVHLPVLGRA
jgi:hypothetical protein